MPLNLRERKPGLEKMTNAMEISKAASCLCRMTKISLVGPAAVALCGTIPPQASADGVHAEIRVEAPERPFAKTCYQSETELHIGAIMLEEIEGEAIDGFSYGTQTTAEGESWGYFAGILAELNGAVLNVRISVSVEGSEVEETEQWVFVNGGIVTHYGVFSEADCAPIEDEYYSFFAE